jgi:flagellar motor protein MotB
VADDIVNTFSDALFEIYNRPTSLCTKGSQNGWPFCQTQVGVRIFQEAAEPCISSTIQFATSSVAVASRRGPQSGSIWLQTAVTIFIVAFLVVCGLLTLIWRDYRGAMANLRQEQQKPQMVNTWHEAAQQLVQSLVGELRLLNSNQVALSTSQEQLGAGLANINHTNSQLVALASSQANASQELAASQMMLTQATTNLMTGLRETIQQEFAETASQSHADNARIQMQIAEIAARHKALFERLSGSMNITNFALEMPGVRKTSSDHTILLAFDEGLFRRGTQFTGDAESRLRTVAQAMTRISTPFRIDVIGCADEDRALKGWSSESEQSLALNRATTVVNYLMKLGLFAPNRLAALSGGPTDRPFPSDTIENRAKNRTAVLRIAMEEKPFDLTTASMAANP